MKLSITRGSSCRRGSGWVAALAMAVWLGGCPADSTGGDHDKGDARASGTDSGSRDAAGDSDLLDGASGDGSVDADLDAALADADTDAGTDSDGGTGSDAGSGSDGSMGSGDAGPRTPVCDPGTACGAGDTCADGEACVVNACGSKVCMPRAAYCGSSAECAAGSACTTTSIGEVCTPTNGEVCNASTDCPPSHACEGSLGSRSCVLRRIPCFDEFDCPVSYMCLGVQGDSNTCQYVYRPCDSAGTCPLGTCSNIDGIGSTECGAGGACDTNAECTTPGDRCMNLHFIVECGLGGLCNASGGDACASGYTCLDIQGDGYGECVPTGGSCSSQSMCPGGGVCAVPLDRSPPRCFYPQ